MQADCHGLDQAQADATWLADKLIALTALKFKSLPCSCSTVAGSTTSRATVPYPLNPKNLSCLLTGRKLVLFDLRFRAINAQLEKSCRIDLTRELGLN